MTDNYQLPRGLIAAFAMLVTSFIVSACSSESLDLYEPHYDFCRTVLQERFDENIPLTVEAQKAVENPDQGITEVAVIYTFENTEQGLTTDTLICVFAAGDDPFEQGVLGLIQFGAVLDQELLDYANTRVPQVLGQ